jgi:NADPH:quinone reductase-like Zn-dependent oxidoreductase
MAALPAEPGTALVRVLETSLQVGDLLRSVIDGDGAGPSSLHCTNFRLVSGTLEAVASDVADVISAGSVVLALSTLPLSSCIPGAIVPCAVADLLVLPGHISPHVAVAAIHCGFRAYSALFCRLHPHILAPGTSMLVLDGNDSCSRVAGQLACKHGAKVLLHCRSDAEYAALHEASLSDTVLLSPQQDIATAVFAATGGVGADVVLELSEAALLTGAPARKLHPSLLRGELAHSEMPEIGREAAETVRREGGHTTRIGEDGESPASPVLEESAIGRLLAPHGHWVSCRGGQGWELDRPLCELLRAKGATIHMVNDAAWLQAPRWHSVLLHTLQRIIDDVSEGALVPPVAQLFGVPPSVPGPGATMAAATATSVLSAPSRGADDSGSAAILRSADALTPAQIDGVRAARQAYLAAILADERPGASLCISPLRASAGSSSRTASSAADEVRRSPVVILSALAP